MKLRQERTLIALEKELSGLIVPARPVIRPVLSSEINTPPIPSSTQSKEKFLSNVIFDNDKVRMCAMGNFAQEKLGNDRTSSPTVDTISVMVAIQKVQQQQLHMTTVEFDSAYFNAILEREVNTIIGKVEAAMLTQLRPEWTSFIRKDRTMLVRIIRALCSLPECSKLFYDVMCQVFLRLGYHKSTIDAAGFIKKAKDHQQDIIINKT